MQNAPISFGGHCRSELPAVCLSKARLWNFEQFESPPGIISTDAF